MLTLIHNNPAQIVDGKVRVDRKFLTGMRRYVEQLATSLISVHPTLDSDEAGVDTIEVDEGSLGYRMVTLRVDRRRVTIPEDQRVLEEIVRSSDLIYGSGLGAVTAARRLGKPYVLVLENDLANQISLATLTMTDPLRKFVRTLRTRWDYRRRQIPEMRAAQAIHCNGYPMFDAVAGLDRERVLYLDSRMAADDVIPAQQLERRLEALGRAPLRLLFSGRYEPIKGALDAVASAVACLRRGLDVELDCYGQGTLRKAMLDLAAASGHGGRIRIHDSVPFPELVQISRGFDVFVCCHRQHDPSCTYLESLGAGLPIVGYGNRMWARMCQESGAGMQSPMGDVEKVADDIAALAADPATLRSLSLRARSFAEAHTFEREFARRTDALRGTLERVRRGD